MTKLSATAILLLALVVTALTGCTTPTTTPNAGAKPAAAVTTQAATAAAPAPQTTWGDTVTFNGGLTATVTAASQPAGEYPYGAVEGRIVVVTLTLTNTSQTPINAVFTSLPRLTSGTAGIKAESAYDNSINLDTVGNMLPGETRTVTSGYGVPTANYGAVRVEVTAPDMVSPSAVFKGAIQ